VDEFDEDEDQIEQEIFRMLDALEEALKTELNWERAFGSKGIPPRGVRYPMDLQDFSIGDRCFSELSDTNKTRIYCEVISIDHNERTALIRDEVSGYEFVLPLYRLNRIKD